MVSDAWEVRTGGMSTSEMRPAVSFAVAAGTERAAPSAPTRLINMAMAQIVASIAGPREQGPAAYSARTVGTKSRAAPKIGVRL